MGKKRPWTITLPIWITDEFTQRNRHRFFCLRIKKNVFNLVVNSSASSLNAITFYLMAHRLFSAASADDRVINLNSLPAHKTIHKDVWAGKTIPFAFPFIPSIHHGMFSQIYIYKKKKDYEIIIETLQEKRYCRRLLPRLPSTRPLRDWMIPPDTIGEAIKWPFAMMRRTRMRLP